MGGFCLWCLAADNKVSKCGHELGDAVKAPAQILQSCPAMSCCDLLMSQRSPGDIGQSLSLLSVDCETI